MSDILVVQTVFPHYRTSFFELLTAQEEFEISVVAGKQSGIKSSESNTPRLQKALDNSMFSFAGHTFFFQRGLFSLLRQSKPKDVVFGGPDFHVLSTVLIFFYLKIFTPTRIHWWTHGISKNGNLLQKMQLWLIGLSDSVLTYESAGEKQLKEALGAKQKVVVTTLKNAINSSDYGWNYERNQVEINDQKKDLRVLFVGRLTQAKRCDILIQAAEILKSKGVNFKVTIVGEGEELTTLQQLADARQVNDKVHFMGARYGAELVEIFQRANIFVLPGKVGLSVVQAMSYGLPVITTDKDIHSPEIALLKENVNGMFFQGFSAENLAETILCWQHSNDEEHQLQKRRKIQNTVIQAGYTPQNMVENFIKHFKLIRNACS